MKSRSRWYVACVVLVALAALIAACGDDDDGSGGSPSASSGDGKCEPGVLDKVNAELDKYREAPTFEPPGPAFDASKARGKTIFSMPLTSTDTFAKIVEAWQEKAAESVGVNVIRYATDGSPASWVAGMNSAVNRKVDLILLEGSPDPRLLKPQLAAAQAAGIKVMSTHLFDRSIVEETLETIPNIDALVASPHRLGGGTLSALYAIAYTKCDLNALMLAATDVVPSKTLMIEAYKEEIEKHCPDTCKLTVIEQPYAKWATEAQGAIQSALNADPNVNIVAPQYDYGVTFAQAAITATGRTDKTHIVSYNGSADIMQMIADGRSLVADIGEPLPWIGYANIDQALRLLSGVEPVRQNTPVRIWDESNIAEAGNPVSQTEGYGPVSGFVDGYEKLWGVQN